MKKLLLAAAMLLPLCVLAQSKFHDGYIVKSNGDTERGYISYPEGTTTPGQIQFKAAGNTQTILSFDPTSVTEFAAGKQRYITYKGFISTDKANEPDIPKSLDTSKKEAAIFLKEIYKGIYVSLYSYTDNIKTRFFAKERTAAPVELQQHLYYTDNILEATDTYKQQLVALSNKYPAMTRIDQQIELTPYEELRLIRTVKLLNNDQSTTSSKLSFKIYAGAGLTHTKLEFNDPFRPLVANREISSPRINAGVEISGNPDKNRLAFRMELAWWHGSATYPMPLLSGVYTLKYSNITISPRIMCNVYNTHKLRVFLASGLNMTLIHYTKNNLLVDNPTYGISDNKNFYNLEKIWYTLPISAGVSLNKKIEINATYELRNDISRFRIGYARSQMSSIGINYFFGRN